MSDAFEGFPNHPKYKWIKSAMGMSSREYAEALSPPRPRRLKLQRSLSLRLASAPFPDDGIG
eukprot:4143608-Pyramimonas_sp.AAC.1